MPALALVHRRQGAGPPLLFLHGLLGSGRNWQSIAGALADRYDVVLPDLRNHGRSPWSDQHDYPAMAEDLAALQDSLGLGPLRLVGHSMGGKVAMALALTAPERIERLCVVDIAPVAYPPGLESYVEAMRALDPAAFTRRAEVESALAGAVPDPAFRAFLLQNLDTRDDGLAWRPNLGALGTAMPTIRGFPDLAARPYTGPTLFLRGERSDYISDQARDPIHALFPHAAIQTVPHAGHWVHAEQPTAFLARLTPFLAG